MNRLPNARLVAAALALAGSVSAALAADTSVGRQKAQACAVCHGALGPSVTPDAPNLAGQPQVYVEAQLRAYRSGKRQHEVMAVMAKTLSDDDIRALAAWSRSRPFLDSTGAQPRCAPDNARSGHRRWSAHEPRH